MIRFAGVIDLAKSILKLYLVVVAGFFITLPAAQATELKTASQDSYPKYHQHNGVTMTGICIEIRQAVAAIEPSIQFTGQDTFLPMVRIKKGLKSGELDVFFGFAKSSTREKNYRYAQTPLYPVNYVMALRHGDTANPTNLADIQAMGKDGEILVLANTGAARFLQRHGKLIIDTGARDINANLMKINAGKCCSASGKCLKTTRTKRGTCSYPCQIYETLSLNQPTYTCLKRYTYSRPDKTVSTKAKYKSHAPIR